VDVRDRTRLDVAGERIGQQPLVASYNRTSIARTVSIRAGMNCRRDVLEHSEGWSSTTLSQWANRHGRGGHKARARAAHEGQRKARSFTASLSLRMSAVYQVFIRTDSPDLPPAIASKSSLGQTAGAPRGSDAVPVLEVSTTAPRPRGHRNCVGEPGHGSSGPS
jgi:hypothetical protein